MTFPVKWLPRPVHRLALRAARGLTMLWRRIHRRPPRGCAVIIVDDRGHVLLVRHTYVEPLTWMLPAGRIGRHERAGAAARRELAEETGCRPEAVELVEFEDTEYWGRRHRTYIFDGLAGQVPTSDMREIHEAAFFPLDTLPETVSMPTRQRLERWKYRRSFAVPMSAFIRPEYLESRGLRDTGA